MRERASHQSILIGPMCTKINCLLTKGFFLRFDHLRLLYAHNASACAPRENKSDWVEGKQEKSRRHVVSSTRFLLSLLDDIQEIYYILWQKKPSARLSFRAFSVQFYGEINYIQLNAMPWQLCLQPLPFETIVVAWWFVSRFSKSNGFLPFFPLFAWYTWNDVVWLSPFWFCLLSL